MLSKDRRSVFGLGTPFWCSIYFPPGKPGTSYTILALYVPPAATRCFTLASEEIQGYMQNKMNIKRWRNIFIWSSHHAIELIAEERFKAVLMKLV